ncbi:MAG TPA: ATP-binding protein [Acidimicrobiia bacterium]|nr:ATP-binding protein [Acidimicrobiia bacterium]
METRRSAEADESGTRQLRLRVPQRTLNGLLLVAAVSAFAELVAVLVNDVLSPVPWIASGVVSLVVAAVVLRKLPDNPVGGWLAVMAGCSVIAQSLDTLLAVVRERGADPWLLLGVSVPSQLLTFMSMAGAAHVFGLFPDSRTDRRWQGIALSGIRWLVVLPLLLPFVAPSLALPAYHGLSAVESPLYILPMELPAALGITVVELAALSLVVAAVMLVARYRRMGGQDRKRTRWLLVPVVFGSFAVTAYAVFDWPNWLFSAMLVGTSLAVSLALWGGLLAPARLDVDWVLRRTVLYGSIWLFISAGYIGIASALGLAAGQRFSTTWAVAATAVAALAFQPFRARLESAADRWIFGVRADPARTVARLGSVLTETYDLPTLVPRMETALCDGLDLEWVRIRLTPFDAAPSDPAALSVPIIDGEETLGMVDCGPRGRGRITHEDRTVVETFARQAALAVRNLHLTRALSEHVTELERSRARLIHAQEQERRSIERDLHDGAQQELVALIALAGRLRRGARDEIDAGLADLQHGLERVLREIRDLARGIHPHLLRHRGLLIAVEDIAARLPAKVGVRADPSLRGVRLPEAVEGAAYYVVAESLTNALRHARAQSIHVTLARRNGSVEVSVRDDGIGVPDDRPLGNGLANLADRVTALGGSFHVEGTSDGTIVTAVFGIAE